MLNSLPPYSQHTEMSELYSASIMAPKGVQEKKCTCKVSFRKILESPVIRIGFSLESLMLNSPAVEGQAGEAG